jgi:Mu-like prophage I protein
MSESLNRVILSNPTLLPSLTDGAKRSWIQLAKTGSFVSNRYGKFSITKKDLSEMLHNFTHVTPRPPTELPVDYDHLSMDVKKPGDGVAAGWMKQLALREEGEELWAEVEWTPEGADRISNREYRFVSPSFVKDHTHKDGKKIGTTLLAAAITNHPFLEGMRALTLYNFSAHGDLALARDYAVKETEAIINLPFGEYTDFDDCVAKNSDKDDPKAFCGFLKHKIEGSTGPVDMAAITAEWTAHQHAISLATEVGQRVMISPGNARTQDEIGGTFEIAEVVGDGDDAFVSVKDANGLVHKWFRATELLPASTVPANPPHPGLQAGQAPVVPAQMPIVPTQPVTQALNPAQVQAAQAAQVAAGLAAPAAVPGAAVVGAAAAPTKENEGATGSEAPPFGKKKKDEEEDVTESLKKAVASLLAGGGQKGIANMMFKLRNDKNEEFEVSADQLAAAGIKVVPEGSTAIPTNELSEMVGKITNLSSTVDTLKAEAELKAKEGRTLELRNALGAKLRGGFISKTTHDTLLEQFKDAVDLTVFRAIVNTFTTPIIVLNKEHGTGLDAQGEKAQGEQAQEKIIALSQQLAKERGISLSDATKQAAAQLAAEAEAYREHYANTTA